MNDKPNIITRKFETWYDALQVAKHLDFPRERCESRSTNNAKWSGTGTFEAAAYLAEFGWEEGRDKIKGIRDMVFEGTEGFANNMVASIDGSEVNIDGVLKNEPEQMFEFKPKLVSRKGRVVHICCNITFSCDVGGDEIMQYGGALCALIDSLESRNFRCEVEIQDVSNDWNDNKYEVLINLKRPEQFLDYDVLSFWLIHPSSLRRIFFAIAETEPENIRNQFGFHSSGGYGRPDTKRRGDVYLDPTIINIIRRQGVVVWVRDKLKEVLKDFEEGYKAVDPNETEHTNEYESEE